MRGYRVLSLDDFTKSANTANKRDPAILELVAPEGYAIKLSSSEHSTIRLGRTEAFTVTIPAGGAATRTVTLTGTLARPGEKYITDGMDRGDAYRPGMAVRAYRGATRHRVTAINYATREITIDTEGLAAGDYTFDLFYLIGDGDLRFERVAPGVREAPFVDLLKTTDLRKLHAQDIESFTFTFPERAVFPPYWTLRATLISADIFDFTSGKSVSFVSIPSLFVPVTELETDLGIEDLGQFEVMQSITG